MSAGEIHQLLHGYENGHRKLAGSLRLPAPDDELINRMSDLSGPLLGSTTVEPYFTGYPLPSGEYYAVARTWIDHEASRAGSVLTHTLLIPTARIGEIEDFRSVFELLRSRPTQSNREYYEKPFSGHLSASPQSRTIDFDERVAFNFVEKYFGEGLRPILWLDAPSPIDTLALVARGLWPRMRQQFAFCTLSLQLRNLKGRPFDLLFAPSSRLNKHHQLESTHLVGTQYTESLTRLWKPQAHEWQMEFARVLFFDQQQTTLFQHAFVDIWAYLQPVPTVIPRLYRLQELKMRVGSSPTATVGIMDLLSSLTPQQDHAVAYKTKTVLEGVESARNFPTPSQSLRTLYLLSERLVQPPFLCLPESARRQVTDAVSSSTMEDPQAALQIGEQAISLTDAAESPYVEGVAEGLAQVARTDSHRLVDLEPSLASLPSLIALQPMIAATYFDTTRSSASAQEISRQLAESIAFIEGEKARRCIREALLPKVAARGEVLILKQLLLDLAPEDVSKTLDSIQDATGGFSIEIVRQAVIADISEKHPATTREWGRKTDRWTFGTASVVAGSFAPTVQGLNEVALYKTSGTRKPMLLAAYVDSQGRYKIPGWLREQLGSNADLFMQFLVDGVQEVSEVCSTIARILSEIPDIQFSLNDSLRGIVDRFQGAPFGKELVDVVMAKAVTEYIQGAMVDRDYDRWIGTSYGQQWFGAAPHQRIASLFIASVERDTPRWARAWDALKRAPDALYHRRTRLVKDLIGSLLGSYPGRWPSEVSDRWRAIIERAVNEGSRWLHLALCEQALGYAFKHPELPLSKLVVVAFPVIYRQTMEDSSSSQLVELFMLLTPFSTWDKGKELRREIVENFLKSEWPPEDLALAMPDQDTLRKIFKRLHRNPNGDRFISKMSDGLRASQDPRARELHYALKKMMATPDFYEPWI